MKLATYLPPEAPQDGTSFELADFGRAAVVVHVAGSDILFDLQRNGAEVHADLPGTMLELIEAGPRAWDAARELASAAGSGRLAGRAIGSGDRALPVDLVRLLAPLPNPASLRDFYAFETHVGRGFEKRGESIPEAWYELPAYYKGNHRSILGPDEELPWPAFTEELDYELELAMIVGRRGRGLDVSTAADHIFGYTLMNDVSARDLQRREMQVRLGPAKSKDFATVLGPVIVTADAIDIETLHVTATIDGEVVTDTGTDDMRWSFAQMLVHVSEAEDVFPGDVYGSGTVAGGCGLEHGRLPQPGELIELHTDAIGTLSNRVGARHS